MGFQVGQHIPEIIVFKYCHQYLASYTCIHKVNNKNINKSQHETLQIRLFQADISNDIQQNEYTHVR